MDKKYELTDETKEHGGHTLHRIRALRDFENVYKYDFGGWIESEENLSHEGGCWVAHEAMVYWKSIVRDNGRVRGHAVVTGHATVSGDAIVSGYAVVTDNAIATGHTIIDGYAIACGNSVVRDEYVTDQEIVSKGYAVVKKREVSGCSELAGNAVVRKDGLLRGRMKERQMMNFIEILENIQNLPLHERLDILESLSDEQRKRVLELFRRKENTKRRDMIY